MVQTKRKSRRVTGEIECLDNVKYSMFYAAHNKSSTRSGSVRLCGDLTDFEQHVESRAQQNNPKPCEACGADYYTTCVLCNAPLHFFPQRGCHTKNTCFLKYHSDAFFGLARSDSTLIGKTKNERKEPSKKTLDKNAGRNQANELWTIIQDVLKGCRP